jgi:hypothetical protein
MSMSIPAKEIGPPCNGPILETIELKVKIGSERRSAV